MPARSFALVAVSVVLLACGVPAGCSGGGGPVETVAQYEIPVERARRRAQTVQENGGPRYVIVTNGYSPFWDAVAAGMNEAGEELGVRVTMERNDGSASGQIAKLQQIATQADVAGVAVSIVEEAAAGVADEMRRLRDMGVHVLAVDSDGPRDARYAFVGTNNSEGGRELGIAARELRPEGGEYICFVGLTGAQNARERIDGFREGVGPRWHEAASPMADEIDLPRARQNVRTAIQNHPELNTLVGIWSYNAPAIVDVVRDLGRRDDFTIVAFDAEPGAIQAQADGMIDAMVVQNPYEMGYQSVRLLHAMTEEDQATIDAMLPNRDAEGGDAYDTGLKVVVPEGSPVTAEAFGDSAEFMTLEEFRRWLEEYGLTGS